MKSDRELLELAAKAAGHHLEFLCDMPHMIVEEWSGDPSQHPEQRAIEWSPLTDDGDALRLAVALELDILRFPAFGEVQVCSQNGVADEAESTGLCAISATRRAIVRAAAAIGEAMQ